MNFLLISLLLISILGVSPSKIARCGHSLSQCRKNCENQILKNCRDQNGRLRSRHCTFKYQERCRRKCTGGARC
ncbi:unnamed protein product [Cylicocyclus nassatus]|uniref:Uncharacterized protein n=1 Tax=Cylicocyclus nassatus TaxID=53992 RepID=A0AA36GVZ3_CYLNA|nr:unnamed protein product [Cylicocyclus nassatus]